MKVLEGPEGGLSIGEDFDGISSRLTYGYERSCYTSTRGIKTVKKLLIGIAALGVVTVAGSI